jgi:hypothetical protein
MIAGDWIDEMDDLGEGVKKLFSCLVKIQLNNNI